MDLHQATWDALRAKGYEVGPTYVQDRVGAPAHLFVTVGCVSMPIEWAKELADGVATLEQITKRTTHAG